MQTSMQLCSFSICSFFAHTSCLMLKILYTAASLDCANAKLVAQLQELLQLGISSDLTPTRLEYYYRRLSDLPQG